MGDDGRLEGKIKSQITRFASRLTEGWAKPLRRFGWRLAVLTPLACATIHFSYGVGALKGFWSWVILKGRFVPRPEMHSMSR